jgi:hypothetical protein
VDTDSLAYALPAQSVAPWRQLNDAVKNRTADLQRVASEVAMAHPFTRLRLLDAIVEERFVREPVTGGSGRECLWLQALGEALSRVKCDCDTETARVRSIAQRLAQTRLQVVPGLEVIPYIDGTPAGMPRRADVVWRGSTLYVDYLPAAKLAKRVPEEIARVFSWPLGKSALDFSFERSPREVREYMEENYQLDAAGVASSASEPTPIEAVDADSVPVADRAWLGEERLARLTTGASEGSDGGTDGEATLSTDHQVINQLFDEPTDDGTMSGDGDCDQGALVSAVGAGRPTRRRSAVDIVERFALARGFRRVDERRFEHPDGRWIARTTGDRFPWEHGAPGIEERGYYWPKDHCLERTPLQLDADVWGLIDRHPDRYALILASPEGGAVAVGGRELQDLVRADALRIYPASYRLVRAA